MSKHFNTEHHQDYYEGWDYLGSDDKYDYYVLPWSKVNMKYNDRPYLSIVYGNEPHQYISPDYKHLLSGGYDSVTDVSHYKDLKKLLLNNGYHLTGKSDSSDDWETDSPSDWV